MTAKALIEEDLQLKQFARTRRDAKPSFDWAECAAGSGRNRPALAATVATIVGESLTDLMLARGEDDIYNDENRKLVARIVREVVDEIDTRAHGTAEEEPAVSPAELTRVIERTLVRGNSYDLARSFVARDQAAAGVGGGSGDSAVPGQVPGVACRVIRRNGHVVAWNRNKIEVAVRKAFLSQQMDSEPAVGIADHITRQVRDEGRQFIHIEELQDLVQEELMRSGHYKVAAAYVVYRAHRAEVREQEEEEAAHPADHQETMIVVRNEDGSTFFWNGADLRKRIAFASLGLDLCLSTDQIETELRRSLHSEMDLKDVNDTIVLNAKTLIERDADFAKFAGRILLTFIYEEVLGWSIVRDGIEALGDFHRRAFKANLRRGVEIERINPALLDYELDRLAAAIDPRADMDFDFLGILTLYDRYLIIDKTGARERRIETPQLFWMRVAMGIFLGEDPALRTEHIIALYQLYRSRRFSSSTPTLFNSGTNHSQLSSCYLYKVDDSIESIMTRGIAENAFLSKWAGGLGGSWTQVRGTDSYIKGTNGKSQGVIPFLKLHNDQLIAVNQGGKRRGSGCAYLETWHNDIREFLELRRNTGDDRRRTHDMNTANWVPDLFMKRMEAREQWTLFRSNEVPDLHELYGRRFEERYVEYEKLAEEGKIFGEKIPAIELWKEMLSMLFETGHPWITFKDPCNIRSPQDHCGVIHSSNLCTEITLNTSDEETAVCNLGSIVLDNHLTPDGEIDHAKLRSTVRVAVRALDNVIDINFYPTEAARTANMRHRPIGLGIMGIAYCLYTKNLSFESQEAVDFNDEIMEAVAYYAYEASSDLAAERGTYSTYRGSKWDRGLLPPDTIDLLEEERGVPVDVPRGGRMDWAPLRAKIAEQGMRNSNVLAIAPTATISNIMGSSPCIEPLFKNLYVKSNLSGDCIALNGFLVRDLKARGLWNRAMVDELKYFHGEVAAIEVIPDDLKRKYRTAFAIDGQWLVKAAARRQKWIDQSQSLNLFLGSVDFRAMSHMYRSAWRSGLKTTYYLRTLGATSIEQSSGQTNRPAAGASKFTEAEKLQCSIQARMNGEECIACQ